MSVAVNWNKTNQRHSAHPNDLQIGRNSELITHSKVELTGSTSQLWIKSTSSKCGSEHLKSVETIKGIHSCIVVFHC